MSTQIQKPSPICFVWPLAPQHGFRIVTLIASTSRVWIGSQEIHRSGRGFLGFSITTGWCSSQTKGHTSDVQPSIYEILRRIQWKLDDFWWLAPPPLCLNKQLKKCKPEMIHLFEFVGTVEVVFLNMSICFLQVKGRFVAENLRWNKSDLQEISGDFTRLVDSPK